MKELACGIDDVDIVLTEGVCTSNAKVEIDEETGGKKIILVISFLIMNIKIKCLFFIMRPIIVTMMRHGQVRLR